MKSEHPTPAANELDTATPHPPKYWVMVTRPGDIAWGGHKCFPTFALAEKYVKRAKGIQHAIILTVTEERLYA